MMMMIRPSAPGVTMATLCIVYIYRLQGRGDEAFYTVSQKKGATLTMAITLSILDRFAKFFHCCKQQ